MNGQHDPLAQLRDIHLPPDPALWPPAPGWWVLCLFLVVAVTLAIFWSARFIERHRPIRHARKLLQNIPVNIAGNEKVAVLQQMSQLVRRFAVYRFGRQRVASLSGESWLVFLDQSAGGTDFTQGVGRILADGPYQKKIDVDLQQLQALLLRWMARCQTAQPGCQ